MVAGAADTATVARARDKMVFIGDMAILENIVKMQYCVTGTEDRKVDRYGDWC